MGLASFQGMGVAGPMMPSKVCQWFRKAADQGNVAAALALGTMYCLRHGGGPGSKEHARTWFAKAACPGRSPHSGRPWSGWIYAENPQSLAGFLPQDPPHISQGWNMCGVAAATMATAFHGKTANQYEVKRLSGSPMGEGTDWMDIVSAAAKLGCHWELVTFPNDRAGLDVGRTRMMACARRRASDPAGHHRGTSRPFAHRPYGRLGGLRCGGGTMDDRQSGPGAAGNPVL